MFSEMRFHSLTSRCRVFLDVFAERVSLAAGMSQFFSYLEVSYPNSLLPQLFRMSEGDVSFSLDVPDRNAWTSLTRQTQLH
jgi:hypothetical protein